MRVRIFIEVDSITERLRRMGKQGSIVGKTVLGATTQKIAALARPLAPRKLGKLGASVRATRPIESGHTVSSSVVAGGPGLLGNAGRGASAHVRAFNRAQASTRANSVYAAVQEVGHERTRTGAVVQLHSQTGEAHFIEKPALALAPGVPDALLAEMDKVAQ